MVNKERVLVVSCHAVDYVSKCGGVIAHYTKKGVPVKVVCLTCGERGEANSVWKANPGCTREEVAEIKRNESKKAAGILGAEVTFLNYKDHPLVASEDNILALAAEIIQFQPTILLTHHSSDMANPDHMAANAIAISALRCAHSCGVFPGQTPCKHVEVFVFEPAKPDMEHFNVDTYIDITDTIDIKRKAMKTIETQTYLLEVCESRDSYRGGLARRHSEDETIQYAEGFLHMNPYIGKAFTCEGN